MFIFILSVYFLRFPFIVTISKFNGSLPQNKLACSGAKAPLPQNKLACSGAKAPLPEVELHECNNNIYER